MAGLVLAAILVPQGMAYAELAGLPAVTGLYTTIACLVGYAIFGPSRVLVLGPDSSVSPLIFAAIVPILGASKDPADRDRPRRACWRCSSGPIEIGLGVAKLGFVADLLSKEVQVGYMNGLAHRHHRRAAAQALSASRPTRTRSSTRSRRSCRASARRNPATLAVGLGHPGRPARAAPDLAEGCRRSSSAIAGATVVSAVLDLSAHGVETVGALPQGLPRPSCPGPR